MGNKLLYILCSALWLLTIAGCADGDDLAAGSSETEGVGGETVTLRLDAEEQPWTVAAHGMTRAGETLSGLQATTGDLPDGFGYGFGLYSTEMALENRQATWDITKGNWDYGNDIYWPRTSGVEAFSVYAYAPYKTVPWTITDTNVTFTTAADGTSPVDLLYASNTAVSRTTGETALIFRHALAKVSLGTIANMSVSTDMLVSEVAVSGDFYTSGALDLATGVWSDLTGSGGEPVKVIGQTTDELIFVPSGGQTAVRRTWTDVDTDLGIAIMQVGEAPAPMFIPGPTATVTYKYYEQPDLVSLTDDMFHRWSGSGHGGAATVVGDYKEVSDYANNIGKGVGGYATIMGSAQVDYRDYADLTGYDKLIIAGTQNLGLRLLFNRLSTGSATGDKTAYYSGTLDANDGQLVECWANIGADGYVVVDLNNLILQNKNSVNLKTEDGFLHLNAIKVHGSSASGSVSKLLLLKSGLAAPTKTVSIEGVTNEQGVNKTVNLRVGQNFEVFIDD